MACVSCRKECGHVLVITRHADPADTSGYCKDTNFWPDCAVGTACWEPNGSPATPNSEDFTCTRFCKPSLRMQLPTGDEPNALPNTSLSLRGLGPKHYSSVYCNFHKTTKCFAPPAYTACVNANSGKSIYTHASAIYHTNSAEHASNSTHADCGPATQWSVNKDVWCAKICQWGHMKDGKAVYNVNAQVCDASPAVCKPAYCRMLASIM